MLLDQKSSTVQPLMCEGTSTVDQILSSKLRGDWRGSLTTFKGFTGTFPEKELIDASWDEVMGAICPEKPLCTYNKKLGEYFVPCSLKEAPLVGNTLEIAKREGAATIGKMRSKSHVTEADMLVMDIDGLSEAGFFAGLDKIKNDGITYLAYTTYSHGNPAKPGMRVRIVIPLDRALNIEEYAAASRGFDSLYWDGQAGKADPTGANLYQQQGTWCCDPNRKDRALSWVNNGGVVSADALIAIGRETQLTKDVPARVNQHNATTEYPPSDANKVADACQQIGLFRDNKGADQSEPLWIDCLGVVGHCEDGAEHSQKWSSGHADYNETDTARKLDHRLKFPPTTCNRFRKTNPEGCKGCKQTCSSPITLGWQAFKAIEGTASNLNVELPAPVATATQQDDEAVIAGLASLKPMEYDRLRKEMAKKLGVQVKTLDILVKAARNEVGESGNLSFPDVEPWPEPLKPAQLLDEILNIILRFVVLDFDQAVSVTLWIGLTWFMDYVDILALLLIDAPEKSCAKSLLLELVGRMAARPLPASNISTAVLFRANELWKPTLLIDEADTFIRDNYEAQGLINAGYSRSNPFALRTVKVGDNHEPKGFNVRGPKALAGIALEKHLSDATMSRGIRINMRRKMPHESVKRLRHAELGLFEPIKSKLARFAIDYSQQVQRARPVLPEELSDRAQDNWEPLIAIAGCAGPKWEKWAIAAALKLSSASESSVSIGNELLADIRQVFEREKVDKISSVDLITALMEDDEAPWATFNRGKSITPRQLAKYLDVYGIKSKTVRMPFGTPKGYDLGQFRDVFDRYLPPPEVLSPQVNDSATQDESGNLGGLDPLEEIY